ncbi:GntR family transcriptional regulator [Proteiniclasticum ruminis]|uniref:DNA-binding transcriptional regulator, GntR family n=1 Tax=Proteiniclasticum ruminis TaxID=398199 RepID=A0A1I5BHH2_9CLOT|nr:GntR family transcriptional regulator [Proteiniclasticum ruminis]SFN74175.1 DNA-binding transcriptional regulator, GntR family [Proteiniclasticum ruminis]
MKISGLKEYVYHELKKKLMEGHIKQGERIWEEQIAEELGVSRTPVREAINRLIAEGFVQNEPRKGIFAAEISKEDLIKMLDIRIVLEALSVDICCRKITDDEIIELQNIYQEYTEKLTKKDFAKASQLDSRIHKFIAKVSENLKLMEYINDIQDFFTYTRTASVLWDERKIKRSLEDHKELVEAISEKNGEKAKLHIEKDIYAMKELLMG